jgi:hypothetical protein
MIPPRLRDATTDLGLRGAPLLVYVYLLHELDPVEHRPLKILPVATILHLKEVTTWRAIRRLVDNRYLEQGPVDGRIRTYRLVWSAPGTRDSQAVFTCPK